MKNSKVPFIPFSERHKWSKALLGALEPVYFGTGRGFDQRIFGWVPKMLGM